MQQREISKQHPQNFKDFTANLLPSFRAVMKKVGKIAIISTMSGTSTDAVDVGFFEITAEGITLNNSHTLKYSEEDRVIIKNAEHGFCKAYAEHPTVCRETLKQQARKYYDIDIATRLSENYHIKAIKELLTKLHLKKNAKLLISYHGQTSFHKPSIKLGMRHSGITIQIGDPQVIADALAYPVVGDHRVKDVENGGQGAPFAPLYHYFLYKLGLFAVPEMESCITVNCGGIANIALLTPETFSGFDTGPGAGLIQSYLTTYHHEQQDTDGVYASQGCVNEMVLQALFEKSVIQDGVNYFGKKPPKSLDFHEVILIPELTNLSKQDACATLAAFTAESIIRETGASLPSTWILTGGGWNNQAITAELENRLKQRGIRKLRIFREKKLGLDFIECGIFAFSALFRILGWPYTYPETTGVADPTLAGNLYFPKNASGFTSFTVQDLIQI